MIFGNFSFMKSPRCALGCLGRWPGCLETMAIGMAIGTLPITARAANSTWTGANGGSWNDSGNWTAAGIPGATSGTSSADTAFFVNAPANRTITVDAGRNVSGITFATSATNFTVGSTTGNTLTLTAGGTLISGSNAGTGVLRAVDAPLSLAGAYTFTNSNTLISGNILSFGGTISSLSSGTSTLTVNGSGKTILSGGLSVGAGGLILSKAGAGELEISGGVSSLTRIAVSAGTMTYSGGTTSLLAPSNNFINVGTGSTLAITGGELDFGSNILGNAFGGGGSVLQTGGTVAFSGTAVMMANVSFGGVVSSYTITGGSYITSGSTTLRGIGNFTAGGTAQVQFNGISNTSTSAKLADSDAGTLTVGGSAQVGFANGLILAFGSTGKGTLNLDGGVLSLPVFGAGSGTSTINFNGGTLKFTAAATLGATQALFLNVKDGGAVVDTGGNSVLISQVLTVSGTGGLTKVGSGTLTLSGANTYTGVTTVSAGVLKAGVTDSAFGSSSALVLANASGAAVDLANFNQTVGSLSGGGTTGGNVILGSGTLSAGSNNASTSYGGVISGSGGFVKQGTGTMTLSGTQTYSGATTVSAGTLQINGKLGNGGVMVASGGVLGGNLTVGGTATISSGGMLAVGNSAGSGNFSSLSLSGSNATSRTEMEFDAGATPGNAGSDYDTIAVSSSLIYGGELKLVFNGTVGGGTFDLFNFGALTPGNDFGSISLYAGNTLIGQLTEISGVWRGIFNLGYGSGGQSFSFADATGDLTVAVPEPSTWISVGLGLGLLLFRRRRAG